MSNLIIANNKNNEIDLFSDLENFKILYMNQNNILDSIYIHLDTNINREKSICIIESVQDFDKIGGFGSLLNSIFHSFDKVIFLFDSNDINLLNNNFFNTKSFNISNNKNNTFIISQIIKTNDNNYLFKERLQYVSKKRVLFKNKKINENDFFINEIDENNNFLSITKNVDLGNANAIFIFNDKLEIKNNLRTIKKILKIKTK